jgi:hypothetical protein
VTAISILAVSFRIFDHASSHSVSLWRIRDSNEAKRSARAPSNDFVSLAELIDDSSHEVSRLSRFASSNGAGKSSGEGLDLFQRETTLQETAAQERARAQ